MIIISKTNYDNVIATVSKINSVVSISSAHGLSEGDLITLNVEPNLSVGIGTSTAVRVNRNSNTENIQVNPIGFSSSSVNADRNRLLLLLIMVLILVIRYIMMQIQ